MSLQITTPPRPVPWGGQQTPVRIASPGKAIQPKTLFVDLTGDDDSTETDVSRREPTGRDTSGWSLVEALKAAEDTLPEYMKAFDEAMEHVNRAKKQAGGFPGNILERPSREEVLDGYAEYMMEQVETVDVEEVESAFSSSRSRFVEESGSAASSSDTSVDIMENGLGTDWLEISKCTSLVPVPKSRSSWDGSFSRRDQMNDSGTSEESALSVHRMLHGVESLSGGSANSSSGSHSSRSQSFRRIESSTGSSDRDSGFVSVDTDIKILPASLNSWGGRETEKRKTRGSKGSELKIMYEAGNSFVNPGPGESSKKSRKSTPTPSPASPFMYGSEYQYTIDDNVYYSYDFVFKEGIRRSKDAKSQGVEKPYVCPVTDCPSSYKNANGLKYHAQYGHSPKQVFACDTCLKTYGTKHGLNAHKKVHNNIMKKYDVPRVSPFKLVLV